MGRGSDIAALACNATGGGWRGTGSERVWRMGVFSVADQEINLFCAEMIVCYHTNRCVEDYFTLIFDFAVLKGKT